MIKAANDLNSKNATSNLLRNMLWCLLPWVAHFWPIA